MSLKGLVLLVLVAALEGCGPSADASDGTSSESETGGTSVAETSTTTAAEPSDDLSWLVGKFVLSCSPYPETPFVHGCSADTFEELEFHADGTMTTTHVMCGERSTFPDVAIYGPAAEQGIAPLAPGAGFDHVNLVGPAPSGEVHRTGDCMTVEVVSKFATYSSTHFFVRGAFEYVRGPEGCSAEAFITEVPQCPADGE